MVEDLCLPLSDQEVGLGYWMKTVQIRSKQSSLVTGSTVPEWLLSGEHLWRGVVMDILAISLTVSPSKCGDQTHLLALTPVTA